MIGLRIYMSLAPRHSAERHSAEKMIRMESHGCVNLFIVHLYPYALWHSDNCSAGCCSVMFHSETDNVVNIYVVLMNTLLLNVVLLSDNL
jgi:hypothetical protein